MPASRQRGVGLIDALAAMLVFSFGLLGLAALYVDSASAPFTDQTVVSVQTQADALMSMLATNQPALSGLSVSGVSASSSMPSWLQGWFSQAAAQIPGLSVTIVPGADALGNACSSTSCGITATLSWTQGSSTRSQVFHGQIGLH